ncbi:MAG: peptidoglycan DD-metalloendopeptidase family protein [Bacteroidota bacterium]
MKEKVEQHLKLRNDKMGKVFPTILSADLLPLDLSAKNDLLTPEVVSDTVQFDQAINSILSGKVGIGGFLENRSIYRRSTMYTGEETRSIHLGVDVWTSAYTKVYAPWAGKIHSFRNNGGFGDYGPTIILEHQIERLPFFTLYGHLSRGSLENIYVGQVVNKKQKVGELGPYPENGDWPPHLHFQVMTDLLGNTGDFPGVIAPSEIDFYQTICIDPMLLLTFR